MIRPEAEEPAAVSSTMTTGAISITGSTVLPAMAVDAAPAKAAASTNFFILFLQLIAHGKCLRFRPWAPKAFLENPKTRNLALCKGLCAKSGVSRAKCRQKSNTITKTIQMLDKPVGTLELNDVNGPQIRKIWTASRRCGFETTYLNEYSVRNTKR